MHFVDFRAGDYSAYVHERRTGDDAIVVIRKTGCFHHGLAPAIGAAIEIGTLDLGCAEKVLHQIFRRHCHLVSSPEIVVGQFRLVGDAGRNERPGPVGAAGLVPSIRDGSGVALHQGELQIDRIGGEIGIGRARQPSHSPEQELAVPVGRQLHFEVGRPRRHAMATRRNRALYITVLGVRSRSRHIADGRD